MAVSQGERRAEHKSAGPYVSVICNDVTIIATAVERLPAFCANIDLRYMDIFGMS